MLAFRDALTAFRRSPLLSALSVTTIAFSLFAFGLFGLVWLNIRSSLLKVEERVEIRAFIVDGADVEAIALAANEFSKYPEVLRADIVTQEQALARARTELGEFKDVFEAGFLPASIDLRLREGYRDPRTVKRIAQQIQRSDIVDDIRFGEEWLTQLYKLRNIAGVTGFALSLAFASVAVIIIGATIRMTVMARSKEISVMRLVGATDAFIRRPFLIEGFAKGIMGGMLALILTWVAMMVIQRYLSFDTVFFDARVAALGVLSGALIGTCGSAISVGRHLRRI